MHTVDLVHITPDAEQLVAYMARVSNPANQNNTETSSKLIGYLIKHKHWSPFEMVNMCVQINTTRSIAAQILRHRSFSFQEFSQRYAPVTAKPGTLPVRRQDLKNRQNSTDDMNEYTVQEFQLKAQQVYDMSYHLYEEMLQAGVAKECAREVLPLSSPTTMYMNGSIRSFLHYVSLRTGNGTQLEHKHIAEQILTLIKQQTPGIYKAAQENGLF
jgi:thymidylate synthase (FAD)